MWQERLKAKKKNGRVEVEAIETSSPLNAKKARREHADFLCFVRSAKP